MSAPTAVRAPAARPRRPLGRPRRESPTRAARLLPWVRTPDGSRRVDTCPEAGRLTAWAARSATGQPATRSSARPDRGALVRRHLQQRTRQSIRNLLHRRRRCRPRLIDRLWRSRPDLPQPVPGSPAGGPFRVFCCCDRQAELHRRFFDRDRLPLPAGARPGALNGHYPAFRYYSVLGLLLGPRPSSFRSSAYRHTSPEPSRSPGVKR